VDLGLPEVNGCELSEMLRQRFPGLPVVLMSGFLSQQEFMPGPPSAFLQKPMLPSAVIQAVESMLPPAR
jgi:FixJ family two-component response regulator